MSDSFIQKNQIFFENISKKILFQLNYADLIEEGLNASSLMPLVAEALEKNELEDLEKMAQEASTDIDETISIASDMGFDNTAKYLEGLKGELPGTFTLVKMAFGGDPQKAAEEIGKVTSIVSKLNLARDSFNDAVLLFGTELEKLPFSQEQIWKKFEEEKSDDQGQLTIPGLEDIKVGEFIDRIKEDPLIDVVKMAQEYEGLEGLEFPDENLLRKAAESSYKSPPPPDKFWGKLMSFFGGGNELEASAFADDIMGASLNSLIDKAKIIKASQAEAEKDKEETAAVMANIGDDVQALGQGDQSVVAGSTDDPVPTDTEYTAVDVPGIGQVQLTPQTIQSIVPGFDQKPEAVKDKKLTPIPDLERTVTAPEDIEAITPTLASLINDDPKSDFAFFDPEEAKKAEEKSKKPGEEKSEKTESWIHSRSIQSWLFESKRMKTSHELRKNSSSDVILYEAIFYKDIVKMLKTNGIKDEDIPVTAGELAKRLENQYDVVIKDLPDAAEAAKEGGEKIEAAAKGEVFAYTTGKGVETYVKVIEILKDGEILQVVTPDSKGAWKEKSGFAIKPGSLGEKTDEKKALATTVKEAYYKGSLTEVLLGPLKRQKFKTDTNENDNHTRWETLAGLEDAE